MPDIGYLAAAVAVCGVITWALRALPFVALAPLRNSAVVRFLSERMPVGVLVILALYTLRGVTATTLAPTALALAATVALHFWRRHAVLSILGGTVVHVALVTTVFG